MYFRELFITGVRKGEEEEGTSLSVFFVVEVPLPPSLSSSFPFVLSNSRVVAFEIKGKRIDVTDVGMF